MRLGRAAAIATGGARHILGAARSDAMGAACWNPAAIASRSLGRFARLILAASTWSWAQRGRGGRSVGARWTRAASWAAEEQGLARRRAAWSCSSASLAPRPPPRSVLAAPPCQAPCQGAPGGSQSARTSTSFANIGSREIRLAEVGGPDTCTCHRSAASRCSTAICSFRYGVIALLRWRSADRSYLPLFAALASLSATASSRARRIQSVATPRSRAAARSIPSRSFEPGSLASPSRMREDVERPSRQSWSTPPEDTPAIASSSSTVSAPPTIASRVGSPFSLPSRCHAR